MVLLLAIVAPPADAVAPPPLGDPVDHFAGRKPIGVEGVISLGDGTTTTPLRVQRLSLKQTTPTGDPLPPAETVNPPELTGATEKFSKAFTNGTAGVVQADLDQILSGGAFRPSLEPGILFAGRGIASTNGCPGSGFCLTWFRPSYNADHTLSGYPASGQIAVPFGVDAPESGTDIAIATGTFSEAEGPSIVVAWVHKPAAGNSEIRFAHFIAQRGSGGRVTGLALDGSVQTLGTAYSDSDFGTASPAIAVGDFAGTGQDQAAVVWGTTRAVATTPRFSATLLGDGSAPGLQTSVATQTFEAATDGTLPIFASDGQTGPGATAQRDIRDNDSPIDRLIVSSGASRDFDLYRLDVGSTFTLQTIDGPTNYQSTGSKLESLGDLDGDGLDEVLATPFADFSPSTTAPAGTTGGCGPAFNFTCGRVEILDFDSDFPVLGTSFTVDSSRQAANRIESAVIDARPTKDQRIAPPAGVTDVAALPQVAISAWEGGGFAGGDPYPYLALISINATEVLTREGSTEVLLGANSAGGLSRRPPMLAALPLDGQVELGDPVQDGYTSLEPSVVLNSPPTHFDILGGRAYDPNFCYAGNQYLVPPVCFFDSEYERASSTSSEVSTESTEDWGVSAKVNVDADFGVAQLGAEVRAGYGENFNKVDASSETETVTVNVKARNTDKIYAIRRAYDTLEYPLYQPGAAEPEYVLASTPHTLSKRWIDSSSPEAITLGVNHQPGNILSYPEDLSTDENPFISPTEGTDAATKTTFGRDEFELSDSSDYNYTLTKSKVDADSAATTKRWNVGATISGGGGLGSFVSVKAEVSGDYSQSDLSTVETTIGDETKLVSTMAGIDESFGETAYTVKPFAYWTENAALVLDYAVEPSVAPLGAPKTWWQQQYGVRPDLTLNLPRLLDFEEQAGITSDAARFISPGVKVLQGPCTHPSPLGEDSTGPGSPLCLVAQVENYSLKDGSTDTRVEFYDADPDLGGELIGHDDIPAVTARDNATAMIDWMPGLKYAGTAPRIFAKVEAADTVREIHEDNNKGFRAYVAAQSSTPALHPPEDVYAELGGDEASLDVDWSIPSDLAPHSWLIRAYPEEGSPVELSVAGDQTQASVPIRDSGRYRVVIFAVQGASSSAASHPAEPVDVGVTSSGGTSVQFLKAPEEGSYTGPSVEIAFAATPEDAEIQCLVDGEGRPCRSPLRLGALDSGSHTIQVQANSGGTTVSTPLISWTVDDAAPEAELLPISRATKGSQPVRYRGTDEGGSGLAGFEVAVRRAKLNGKFTVDPVTLDETSELERESSIDVAPGETACVLVRAIDVAGNTSPWTDDSCTSREMDESGLRREGKWKQVSGKAFSKGHALQAGRRGSELSYELDRTDRVRIYAAKCSRCGKLAVEYGNRRLDVIDLGKTDRRDIVIGAFDPHWPRGREGRLRLISLGGGPVIIDGVATWRTTG